MSGYFQRIAEEQEDAYEHLLELGLHDFKDTPQEIENLRFEVERLKEINNKLFCTSCLNTGWIDSDGTCGNCELGRVKGERELLKEKLSRLGIAAQILYDESYLYDYDRAVVSIDLLESLKIANNL